MAKKETKNEVAVVAGNEAVPAFLQDHLDSRAGNENVEFEDLVLPRVDLAQAMSPQLDEASDRYIEGLKVGDMFNNITGEIYGKTLDFIPLYFRKEYLLFKDRAAGGDFGGVYNSQAEAEHNMPDQDGDWEVIQADVNYVLILKENGTTEQAAISMTKTKIKKARRLNTLIAMSKGPRYAAIYRLASVKESNTKGSFYNFDPARVGYIADEALFQTAEEAYKVLSENASTDYSDFQKSGEAVMDDEEAF